MKRLLFLLAFLGGTVAAAAGAADPASRPEGKLLDPNREPFVGWAWRDGDLHLFGQLPSDDILQSWLVAAKAAYPEARLDPSGIEVDGGVRRSALDGAEVMAAPGAADEPHIGIWTASDPGPHFFAQDVLDSTLATALPGADLKLEQLAEGLDGFRAAGRSLDGLARTAPHLMLVSDGRTLHLHGAVDSEERVEILLEQLEERYAEDFDVEEHLAVLRTVAEETAILLLGQALPPLEPRQRGVFTRDAEGLWQADRIDGLGSEQVQGPSLALERAAIRIRAVLRLFPDARFTLRGNLADTDAFVKHVTLGVEAKERLSISGVDAAEKPATMEVLLNLPN